MVAKVIESAELFYKEGSSDKVYKVQLVEEGSFRVDYQYGRRGDSLQSGTKISGVDKNTALKIFEKLVKEKKAKGYTLLAGTLASIVKPPVKSDLFVPHLPKAIDEEAVGAFLLDDKYGVQEKMDGKHLTILRVGYQSLVRNKLGKSIGVPTSLPVIPIGSMVDLEAIGEKYYAFDCMQYAGEDIRKLSYVERYDSLVKVCTDSPGLLRVPFVTGKKKKMELFNRLKKEGREGVVLKLLAGTYEPGFRNHEMVKFKFYSELSARVCKGREGKRSVGLELIGFEGRWCDVGNVTIPSNHEIPSEGSVVEIRYLYGMRGGSLIQPQYKGERDDMHEDECTMDQVKFKAEP